MLFRSLPSDTSMSLYTLKIVCSSMSLYTLKLVCSSVPVLCGYYTQWRFHNVVVQLRSAISEQQCNGVYTRLLPQAISITLLFWLDCGGSLQCVMCVCLSVLCVVLTSHCNLVQLSIYSHHTL